MKRAAEPEIHCNFSDRIPVQKHRTRLFQPYFQMTLHDRDPPFFPVAVRKQGNADIHLFRQFTPGQRVISIFP